MEPGCPLVGDHQRFSDMEVHYLAKLELLLPLLLDPVVLLPTKQQAAQPVTQTTRRYPIDPREAILGGKKSRRAGGRGV